MPSFLRKQYQQRKAADPNKPETARTHQTLSHERSAKISLENQSVMKSAQIKWCKITCCTVTHAQLSISLYLLFWEVCGISCVASSARNRGRRRGTSGPALPCRSTQL